MAKISREELNALFQEPRDDHPAGRLPMYIRQRRVAGVAEVKDPSTFFKTPGNATWSFPVPVRFRNQIKETQDAEQ